MKTKLITLSLLAALVLGSGARAQMVQATAPAPAATAVAPNQTIYAARLPGVNELNNIAAAQRLSVERIEQTASQVTVVYKSADGQTSTVAYLLLPGAAAGTAAAPTVAAPAPAMVYDASPRVVYYDGYAPGYYYPGYWYPPVSIGFGFRGGFRGGFRRW